MVTASMSPANNWKTLDLVAQELETMVSAPREGTGQKTVLSMMAALLRMIAQDLRTGPLITTQIERQIEDARLALREALLISGANTPLTDESPKTLHDALATADGILFARQRPQPAVVRLWTSLEKLAQAQEAQLAGSAPSATQDSFRESGSGTIAGQNDTATESGDITVERLQTYLRLRVPDHGTAVVRSLERLVSGYSKGTYLSTVESDPGRFQEVVIRADLPYSVLKAGVADEFPLLAHLHAQGLPVPRPLWCEPDPDQLGAAAIAVERLPGATSMGQWAGDKSTAQTIARAAAALLGRIHLTSVSSLPAVGGKVPGTRGENPRDMVQHLREFWLQNRPAQSPVAAAVFRWLDANAPAAFSRRVLLHGDFGFHNLLVDGGDIVGVLDWEVSHLGDPNEDLGYTRPFIDPFIDWAEFVRCYRAVVDVEVSDELQIFC